MKSVKALGVTLSFPERTKLIDVFWSWIGAFLGISAVSFLHYHVADGTDAIMLIGSFGASAVLIYGATESPLAQPKNLVLGHFLSALVGVTAYLILPEIPWVAAPLAVATAIAVMQLTGSLHPPGGATALIAVIGGDSIHNLGYLYAIFPVAIGAVVMLIVALVLNNLRPDKKYPA